MNIPKRLFMQINKIAKPTFSQSNAFEVFQLGVNFINVLRAPFSYGSLWAAFFYLLFGFEFLVPIFCTKIVRTLMKLTIGVSKFSLLFKSMNDWTNSFFCFLSLLLCFFFLFSYIFILPGTCVDKYVK